MALSMEKHTASNLISAEINPEVVSKYLQEEAAVGRVVSPLQLASIPGVKSVHLMSSQRAMCQGSGG